MDRQPRGYEDVALGLLVGVAVVAGVLWVGGAGLGVELRAPTAPRRAACRARRPGASR